MNVLKSEQFGSFGIFSYLRLLRTATLKMYAKIVVIEKLPVEVTLELSMMVRLCFSLPRPQNGARHVKRIKKQNREDKVLMDWQPSKLSCKVALHNIGELGRVLSHSLKIVDKRLGNSWGLFLGPRIFKKW